MYPVVLFELVNLISTEVQASDSSLVGWMLGAWRSDYYWGSVNEHLWTMKCCWQPSVKLKQLSTQDPWPTFLKIHLTSMFLQEIQACWFRQQERLYNVSGRDGKIRVVKVKLKGNHIFVRSLYLLGSGRPCEPQDDPLMKIITKVKSVEPFEPDEEEVKAEIRTRNERIHQYDFSEFLNS